MAKSNYIEWILQLEHLLNEIQIEFSDYDEFYIKEAIKTTEKIINIHSAKDLNHLTEDMIDAYSNSAIKNNPSQQEYYETVAYYVKKRLLRI